MERQKYLCGCVEGFHINKLYSEYKLSTNIILNNLLDLIMQSVELV